ncbi:uncharacterized protein LOC118511735 isoform X2 [Anopheles stephensi]|nr:uncharacterized protein LOC118511735 isoform X2 [Anopheles stephensi]XP_035911097.1 uncharacterized protein LOC118511735 isoform X2 [Anopheles stephensi]XP_035911106.1 uncharacterized protein LOC118511735 isoform X2 [Anopheles stephensi]
MEDSSQLANLTDAAFGENSFNIFGGGSEGDLVVEELDDSSTVEQGGGIIDLEGSVEVDNDDVHESDNSVDSEVDERVDESTAAHICKNHSNIGDCLRDWAIVHNQPRSSVNEILDIFRKWTALPLPKDSRTLLKTSTTIGQEIRTVPGGEFWYKGIENKLNSYFQSKAPSTHIISIQLSIDGLPLHRGGPMQVWPILMKVEQMPNAPIMMIGMFCGPAKPESLEVFLRPLVEEGKHIHERGLHIGEEVRQLKIRAIIADSPARAFIKATTYFNGYHGCMRCTCCCYGNNSGRKTSPLVNRPREGMADSEKKSRAFLRALNQRMQRTSHRSDKWLHSRITGRSSKSGPDGRGGRDSSNSSDGAVGTTRAPARIP